MLAATVDFTLATMLNALRESFKSQPYLKWLLIITAASLTLYLGAYFFQRSGPACGANADWAALVNGEAIAARDFLTVARDLDAYYRQLFGDQYEQVKPRLQLGQQVVNDLIANEIMRQEAHKIGLDASAEEISQQILNDPAFRDPQGNFIGKERYAQLAQRRGGVQAYESQVARDIITRKWRDLVTEPVMATADELEALYRFRNEKTAIDYIIVRSSDQELDPNITEQDLQAWYESHLEDYRRHEGRKIRFVVVERQALLDQVQITDEAVAESYETNKAAYSRPERRKARHILFRFEPDAPPETKERIREQAESVLKRVENGEDFASLAKTMSQDSTSAERGGDLGYFGRGQMVPPFEEAAFSTPVGEFAPVVETEFGYHVIQVTDSRPAGVAPLEEVKEEIRRTLQLHRTQELVEEQAARISREAQTPDQLASVAEREGLEVETRTVRRDDRLRDLRPSPEFTNTLFELEVGLVSQPLGVARGMAVVAVDELVSSTIAPLEEVKTDVRVDLLNQRLRDTAKASAERALQQSRDLEAAAKLLKLELQQSGDLLPGQQIPGTGGVTSEFQQALFGPDTATGQRGVVPVPSGALIYEVTRRDPFDPARFEEAKPSLRDEVVSQRRAALLQSIINDLLKSYRVEKNQELIDRVSS